MKILTFYLFLFAKLTRSYMIPNPEIPIKQCLRVTLDKGQRHTIFIDFNYNEDILLKDCIIKKIHKDQTLLLMKGLKTRTDDRRLSSIMPNLIVMSKSLNQELLESFSTHHEIKFHWNMLYIAVTSDDGTYKCKGGKFDNNTFNLIQNFMNDFWQRYEITRVILVFPYSCPRTYVIYGEKLLTDKPLYNRTVTSITPKTFKDLSTAIIKSSKHLSHGYPVKATIFERFPTTIKWCDKVHDFMNFNRTLTNGYCGTDGLIMYEAVRHFKFNMSFSNDTECHKYGYVDYVKREPTGSLGCILDKRVDISFNSRFMVLYTKELLNYVHYVTHDSLCALLPLPAVYPLWHYPHMPMNLNHFVSVILMICILSTTAWTSAIIVRKLTKIEAPTFKTCIFDFATCTLLGFSMKKYYKFYLLRGIALAVSIIFISYYQGYINYTFTTLTRYSRIKTIQQLYESDYVLYTSPSVRELLKPLQTYDNDKQEQFLNRTKLEASTDIGIVLKLNNVVTLGRNHDARSEILLRYRDKDGRPLIYVVDECFCDYYLSFLCRIDFPFTKELKIFMERMLQAGLPGRYYQWTRRTLRLPDTLPTYGPEPRPNASITIKDIRIALGLLLVGYVVSTLAFVTEMWLNRRCLWVLL